MIGRRSAAQSIVEIGRRMHEAGMAPGQDGNISVRLNEREVMITPSRLPKGYLKPSQMVTVDMEGRRIAGELTPSVETPMHLAAYRAYPDIAACIHSHPTFTIVLSLAGIPLSRRVLPEIATVFGVDIPVADYVTPGTAEMGSVLVPHLKSSRVVVQKRHGLFAAGSSIYEAWYRTDQIESCARLLYYAHRLGPVSELPEEEIERLQAIHFSLPDTPPE